MRILYICSMESFHCKRWIRSFVLMGHDVTVLNISQSSVTLEGVDEQINCSFFRLKLLNYIWAFLLCTFWKKLKNHDFIHVHYLGYNLIPALAFSPNKTILTAWGSDVFFCKEGTLRTRLLRYSLKRARVITGDSGEMLKCLERLVGSRKTIYRINFGIETEAFKPANTNKINKTNSSLKIVSLRNLEPVYDIDCLLNATAILRDQGLRLGCHIYGEGSARNQLENRRDALNLQNIVKFHGRYDADKLPKIFASYDVYVSTSTSDAGIASSTAEAMCCEVPVIISDSAENNLWISNLENGLLFETGNPKKLADSLLCFSKLEEPQRKLMARQGRNKIVSDNNLNIEMQKMETLMFETLNSSD